MDGMIVRIGGIYQRERMQIFEFGVGANLMGWKSLKIPEEQIIK